MVIPRPSRARLLILCMLFFSVMVTWMDRANLAIATPGLRHGLKLDTVHLGWLLAAFSWTYAFFQIPGGWLVDRLGPRRLYALLLVLWSCATALMGVAGSLLALIALRLLIGALEAPGYPLNNRVVTSWFPERERASAIGTYTSGQFVGLAFLSPLLVWLAGAFGWQAIFFLTGAVGLVWGLVWFAIYREPRDFALANANELAAIEAGGGLVDVKKTQSIRRADLLLVLGSCKLWGVYLAQFALTSTQWFFLTWFPTYLIDFRHLGYVRSGFYASVPFVAAFCGVLLSGFVSDALLRRGASITLARKAPIITGLLLSCVIIGANYVSDPFWVVGLMALAFFGNGMASISWTLISAMAPRHLLGLTGGVFNFISNLSGIATPLVIGYLAQGGDFAPGLRYVALVAGLGALCYIFLIGKVERISANDSDGARSCAGD